MLFIDDWNNYYFKNVHDKEHIKSLGQRLYVKITEIISAEVEEITENDCINYMFNLVINRTFDGYMTEIKTIYGQLQQILEYKIEPAPDKWDRLFNVDFFIKIYNQFIGLQIKPVSNTSHISQIYKERSISENTHKQFEKRFGGKVFYIFSIKSGKKKIIQNVDIIEDIKREMKRLQNTQIDKVR